MPAKSQAQRGFLAVHFGVPWMREHHFTNKGKLPEHVKGSEADKKKEPDKPKK